MHFTLKEFMMRKVVVFDIGDVLLFTAFERAGRFLEKELGIPEKKITDLFWGRVWGGKALEWFLNLSEGTDEQFHAIAEELLGRKIPEGIFWEMWNKEWVPNEPVIRIVNRLSAMPHPPALAICSNINQPHWTHLCSTYAVFRHFSVAALSYRVGKMKPEHAMFRFVTEQVTASDVAPPVLFVDDRLDNIESAESYGWRAHLYERGKENVLERKLVNFLDAPF